MRKIQVIVTRHAALVEYLREIGLAEEGIRVIPHATENDVRDMVVGGVLPLHLAASAARVIEIPLDLTPQMRGVELTIEDVRRVAKPPVEYSVCRVADVSIGDLDAMETSRLRARSS